MILQTGQALANMAINFIKVFNNIKSPQWFKLTQHLKLPKRILKPWQRFFSFFTRRFQVHNHLNEPLKSDVRFTEGNPLSMPAMVIFDWALHVYQVQYAPLTRTMLFVNKHLYDVPTGNAFGLGLLLTARLFGAMGIGDYHQ